jgi:hypothetical protein
MVMLASGSSCVKSTLSLACPHDERKLPDEAVLEEYGLVS